ncbi:unnamed protein product [Rotaria sp. Silwood1]|nr:unnamed protein product [Rotaria sp. Silwood1]CAF4562162.1 unnamed protein product [Rotaria sp. Silwood1]CAF4680928.1 unnamed protein product [Rotaria sp. Silwood1]
MQKYIHFIEALKLKTTANFIVDKYTHLLNQDSSETLFKVQPITSQLLKSIIYLGSAHTKCCMGNMVDTEDSNAGLVDIKCVSEEKNLEKNTCKAST